MAVIKGIRLTVKTVFAFEVVVIDIIKQMFELPKKNHQLIQ